jgi:hypothetical protein
MKKNEEANAFFRFSASKMQGDFEPRISQAITPLAALLPVIPYLADQWLNGRIAGQP